MKPTRSRLKLNRRTGLISVALTWLDTVDRSRLKPKMGDVVAAKSELHRFELVSLKQILNITSSAVRKSLIVSKNRVALVSEAKAVMYLVVIFIFHSKDCSGLCDNTRTLNE